MRIKMFFQIIFNFLFTPTLDVEYYIFDGEIDNVAVRLADLSRENPWSHYEVFIKTFPFFNMEKFQIRLDKVAAKATKIIQTEGSKKKFSFSKKRMLRMSPYVIFTCEYF